MIIKRSALNRHNNISFIRVRIARAKSSDNFVERYFVNKEGAATTNAAHPRIVEMPVVLDDYPGYMSQAKKAELYRRRAEKVAEFVRGVLKSVSLL